MRCSLGLTALFVFSLSAIADTTSNFNVGGLLGLAFINNNNGTQLAVGVEGEYQVVPNLMLGGYFDYSPLNALSPNSASLKIFAAQMNYRFTENLSGLYVGGKLGFANTSFLNASTTDLTIGPALGYDYPFNPNLTLGGEGNVLFISSNPNTTVINLLATLKFWL